MFFLQSLTADMVLKRPENARQFLIDEIEKMQEHDRYRKGMFKGSSQKRDAVVSQPKKPEESSQE